MSKLTLLNKQERELSFRHASLYLDIPITRPESVYRGISVFDVNIRLVYGILLFESKGEVVTILTLEVKETISNYNCP